MQTLHILLAEPDETHHPILQEGLQPFAPNCVLHNAPSEEQANQILHDLESQGQMLAVAIAHSAPPILSGIDLLASIYKRQAFHKTRTLLLVTRPSTQELLRAINEAHVSHILTYPLSPQTLTDTLRVLLTEYIVFRGLDAHKYPALLDQQTLLTCVRRKGTL